MDKAKFMLAANAAWARETSIRNPGTFPALARGQSPQVLWIGCSDSRVPAEMITHCVPGELFVHRNIANLFQPADDNEMSVLEYAVQVLNVVHIVVCGHYGCGGVRAALGPVLPDDMSHVRSRIAPLRALANEHRAELQALSDDDAANRLAEINVIRQVQTLRMMPVVRNRDQPPLVHGWIFGLSNGRLKELTSGYAQRTDAGPEYNHSGKAVLSAA